MLLQVYNFSKHSYFIHLQQKNCFLFTFNCFQSTYLNTEEIFLYSPFIRKREYGSTADIYQIKIVAIDVCMYINTSFLQAVTVIAILGIVLLLLTIALHVYQIVETENEIYFPFIKKDVT